MAGSRVVPTPHDRLVKRMLGRPAEAAVLLGRVLPSSIVALLDLDRIDVESTTLIDPRLGKRRADLLYSIGVHGTTERVLAPVEHQSSPDPMLPLRMMWTTAWIWERVIATRRSPVHSLPLVLPIVLAQHPRHCDAPTRLSAKVVPKFPDNEALVELSLFVDDLSQPYLDDPAAASPTVASVEVTRALLFAYHHPTSITAARMEMLATLFDIVHQHRPEDALALWTYVVSVFDERSLLRMTLLEAVGSDNRTMCATIKEAWIAEGRRKGVTQGIAQGLSRGHAQGLGAALLQLLEHRQLPVSPSIRRRVLETTEHDAVQQWFGRALTASTLDQIFGPSVSTH